MEKSSFYKLKKYLIRLGAYFILIPLGFMVSLLDGYGWRAFLSRLFVVVISFKLNSYDSAIHQFTTGAMKLFLLTCAILGYAVCKLFFDYTKRGIEAEKRKRTNQ